ncbi:MAG: hypothetical protein IKR59_05880, partial [Lachnospiraceae bacterium]|nr:hypothetical protein [Lachnospiraceae bacterium]
DPEGILRFEVAAQIKSSKAVLFTIDILPEMEKDVKEEIPSVFSVETSESVPPAVSDYMKNNRDQILSILNAEGHAAPADPDEIYIMEPFVVDEDGAVTGQKKKTVCEDYYYPVISGGHLYAVLKCSIPETTNLTRFTQLYSQRKIRLEEDENMLWYLSRPDNEKLLFEGEGWRYRVVHHYGFDYSHFYALRATKFSDGTSVKVFMDLK